MYRQIFIGLGDRRKRGGRAGGGGRGVGDGEGVGARKKIERKGGTGERGGGGGVSELNIGPNKQALCRCVSPAIRFGLFTREGRDSPHQHEIWHVEVNTISYYLSTKNCLNLICTITDRETPIQ